MKEKTYSPLEWEEQEILVKWLEFKNISFSSIPNSTWTSSLAQKIKNKRQGLRGGLPDLLIIHDSKMLFIELKRRTGGVISSRQKVWIERINTVSNCQAIVARGANEAIEQIKKILVIK